MTVFVAYVKMTTLLVFIASCLVVAPAVHHDPDVPSWVAPAGQYSESVPRRVEGDIVAFLLHVAEKLRLRSVIAGGVVPMVVVSAITAPYVNAVHLRVPRFARLSTAALHRFSLQLPPETRLDLTTLRMTGLPKTVGTRVSDLRVLPKRLFRLANLERIRRGPSRESPLWASLSQLVEPRNKFYVAEGKGGGRSKASGIWEKVLKHIEKNR